MQEVAILDADFHCVLHLVSCFETWGWELVNGDNPPTKSLLTIFEHFSVSFLIDVPTRFVRPWSETVYVGTRYSINPTALV